MFKRRKPDSDDDEESAAANPRGFGSLKFNPMAFQSFQQAQDDEPEFEQEEQEEEEERPSMRFNPMSFSTALPDDTPSMASVTDFVKQQNAEKLNSNSASRSRPYGIGASLLAKMGYKSGQGLGKDGQGITRPIEQQSTVRGQGLGANSAFRGGAKDESESDDDDSEDEQSTKQVNFKVSKPKSIYKTVEELRESGLDIDANVLQNAIDMRPEVDTSGSVGITSLESLRLELERLQGENEHLRTRHVFVSEQIQGTLEDMEELDGVEKETEGELQRLEECLEIMSTEKSHVDKLVACYSILKLTDSTDLWLSIIGGLYQNALAEWRVSLQPNFLLDKVIETPEDARNVLLARIWLPKVSSELNNNWDSTTAKVLLESWGPVLPDYVRAVFVHRTVVPKLNSVIIWNNQSHDLAFLRQWWPFLSFTDRQAVQERVSTVLGQALRSWNSQSAPPQLPETCVSLTPFVDMASLVVKNLLPNLSRFLRRNLEINPANQDTAPLTDFFMWQSVLSSEMISMVLESEFFPKWKSTLKQWLISGLSGDMKLVTQQAGSWFSIWQDFFAQNLKVPVQSVFSQFELVGATLQRLQNLEVVTQLDLDEEWQKLTAPLEEKSTEAVKPVAESIHLSVTLHDVIYELCVAAGLLYRTADKFHDTMGFPLYTIEGGKSIVTCYVDNYVFYVKDGADYNPRYIEEVVKSVTV